MVRLFKLLILIPITIVTVIFLVINRAPVTLTFDPFSSDAPAFTLTLPLFIIIVACFALGVLAGGIGAWMKQGKWRKAARDTQYEAARWRRRAGQLKDEQERARTTADTSLSALPAPQNRTAA
ncbi:LapA family protein [Coralliovum pocilloporae]|uniref:LapA family protein n=1 Tax=Coralliovum pocilloporae TaxID=3066369 RepID=UPI0033075A14